VNPGVAEALTLVGVLIVATDACACPCPPALKYPQAANPAAEAASAMAAAISARRREGTNRSGRTRIGI
jgi:hypothetical protein